jgi:hypothetical protein
MLIALALALVPVEAPANVGLTADWHGRWIGTLKITPVDGKEQETPMTMSGTKDPRESKLTAKEDFRVKAHKLRSYHSGELRKAKAD